MGRRTNHPRRRSVLKKAAGLAAATSIAGCTGGGGDGGDGGGGDGGGGDGGGGDGGGGVSNADGLDTFENEAGVPVGANWEAVQELAKDEGGDLTIYSTLDQPTFDGFMEGFDFEGWGISTSYISGDGSKLGLRAVQEYKAGEARMDMAPNSSTILPLEQEGLAFELSEEYLPKYGDVPDAMKTPYVIGQRLKSGAIFYNPDELNGDELNNFMDLVTDDRWKGNFGHDPTPNYPIMSAIYKKYGREWFELLAEQDPVWVDSHSDLARFVAAGRFPLSHTYADRAAKFSDVFGNQMDIMTQVAMPAGLSGSGIAAWSSNPNQALVVINFLATDEGQANISQTYQNIEGKLATVDQSSEWKIMEEVGGDPESVNKVTELWKELGLGADA